VTAPEQDGKLTAAKALFIGFFAAALGWAGVLVAAVAVATEQTWSKGGHERDRARERSGSWMDTQRAWLDQDHRARQARARARQDWLNNGAPADQAPARRARSARAGEGLRRLVANVALAAADFRDGLKRGWRAANDARKSGGGFGAIARTRPTTNQWRCPGCGIEMAHDRDAAMNVAEIWCDACRARQARNQADTQRNADAGRSRPAPDPTEEDISSVVHPGYTFTAEALAHPDGTFGWACRDCPGRGFDFPTLEAATADCKQHPCTKGNLQNTNVTAQSTQHDEGAPMAATTDSNATVLGGKLNIVTTTVADMSEDVDALEVITRQLREKVARAADLAHSAGMPVAAITAVDAIQHAAASIDARLDDFATATGSAADQLNAAVAGLTPVAQAEDKLHAAGADGRALDTAAA
jgi:hypothetical protein